MTTLWTADSPGMVRVALDLSLDANALPDETIESPLFVDDAEDELLALDANALTYSSTDPATQKRRAERALAYLVGARLALQLPVILSEQLGDYKYSRQAFDGVAIAALLRSRAMALIDLNTGGTGESTPLFAFGTACGRRGR